MRVFSVDETGVVRSFLDDGDHFAGAVGAQLRSILALDGGDARGELTRVGDPHVVADDVSALVQVVEEHVGLAVLGLPADRHLPDRGC